MKDWFFALRGNNPLIFFTLVLLVIGLIPLFLNLYINRLLDLMRGEKRVQYKFLKDIFWGISVPAITLGLWFNSFNPINEFKLIVNPSNTIGLITKVEGFSEIIEYDYSRRAEAYPAYYFEYWFETSNGLTVKGQGKEWGEIPEFLVNVKDTPHHINVEYLSENPEVNRIKGMGMGNETLFEWVRRPILFGGVLLTFSLFISYRIIKNGFMDYQNELLKLRRQN